MQIKQRQRRLAEGGGRRPQYSVFEDAATDQHLLGTGIVMVERVLHLEDEHRQDPTEEFVRTRRVTDRLTLVHVHEDIDEIDTRNDSGGAVPHAVEEIHAAVPSPDGELRTKRLEPVSHLGWARLELHEPDVLGRRPGPRDHFRHQRDTEVPRRVLDHKPHPHAPRSARGRASC